MWAIENNVDYQANSIKADFVKLTKLILTLANGQNQYRGISIINAENLTPNNQKYAQFCTLVTQMRANEKE